MADKTSINWTEATWNPTTGCDKVPAFAGMNGSGCDNCYALTRAAELKDAGVPEYQRDGRPETSGPGFGLSMHPHRLIQPVRWTKPRVIFVNSMSDLFHPRVTDDFIADVFAVMAITPRHTFQVLTKRPKRMRALLRKADFREAVTRKALALCDTNPHETDPSNATTWPLPNVWLGVTTENQASADERIPLLADIDAAVRFLSCEPLIGKVVLSDAVDDIKGSVDWVIVGGESGEGSRPMPLEWATSLRDECANAGVAFIFKQLGAVLAREVGAKGKGSKASEWPVDFPQDYPTPRITA